MLRWINSKWINATETEAIGDWGSLGMQMLLVNGSHITGNLKNTLLHHLQSILAKQYFMEKGVLRKGSATVVHWDALADGLCTNRNINLHISKVVCNQLPAFQILH